MKPSVPFSVSILGLSSLLVLVAAIAVRSSLPSPSAPQEATLVAPSSATTTSPVSGDTTTSTVPAFASAAFFDGDALKGLGPEWTFLDQTNVSVSSSVMAGTQDVRVSRIKVSGKDLQFQLTESKIVDGAVLKAALAKKTVKKSKIAGRDGYLVSNGFLLVGSSTTLFLHIEQSTTWPSSLSAELLSYIGTVRVP